jgi:hypothetical protein
VGYATSEPFTAKTTVTLPGTYKFSAMAFDGFGARARSDVATVTITAP